VVVPFVLSKLVISLKMDVTTDEVESVAFVEGFLDGRRVSGFFEGLLVASSSRSSALVFVYII